MRHRTQELLGHCHYRCWNCRKAGTRLVLAMIPSGFANWWLCMRYCNQDLLWVTRSSWGHTPQQDPRSLMPFEHDDALPWLPYRWLFAVGISRLCVSPAAVSITVAGITADAGCSGYHTILGVVASPHLCWSLDLALWWVDKRRPTSAIKPVPLLGRRTPARTDAGPGERLRVPGPYTGHCFYGLPSQCDTPGDAVDAAPRAVQPWVPRGSWVLGPDATAIMDCLCSTDNTRGAVDAAATRSPTLGAPRFLGPRSRHSGVASPMLALLPTTEQSPCPGAAVGTGCATGLHEKKCAPIGNRSSVFGRTPVLIYIHARFFGLRSYRNRIFSCSTNLGQLMGCQPMLALLPTTEQSPCPGAAVGTGCATGLHEKKCAPIGNRSSVFGRTPVLIYIHARFSGLRSYRNRIFSCNGGNPSARIWPNST
jgi:hypothetical protein